MRTILIVEDELLVQDNIAQILSFEGFRVLTASNGLQGVQVAREELPDMIVCDIMMPEMDGYEMLQELSQDLSTATIPIIFLTARVEREDMRKGMELGADDYITKPFSNLELISAVRTRLEKQRLGEKTRMQALSRRILEVQENERCRIVSELNGSISDLLIGLKVMLSINKRLPPETLHVRLDEMRTVIDEIVTQIETLADDLRPAMLSELGILPALLQYFDRYSAQHDVVVNFRHSGLEQRFSQAVETAVFRAVQEATTNVAFHAATHQADVSIWVDQDVIQVQIDDQGVGFTVEKVLDTDRSNGLASLQEYMALIGGTVSVLSSPGAGTQLFVRIPLQNTDAQPAGTRTLQRIRLEAKTTHVEPLPARSYQLPPRSSESCTIALVDRNTLVRQGLYRLLETEEGFTIVGEASTPEEIPQLFEHQPPDVIIIDWEIGLETIETVARNHTQTPILVLSRLTDEAYVTEALRVGATGYALKDSSAEDLIDAVRHVASDRRYLSHVFTEQAIETYISSRRASLDARDALDVLTDRESEVFAMVVKGLKNNEIADILFISPRTVETHRANMMRKLGLHNQTDLIRFVLQHGFASSDD